MIGRKVIPPAPPPPPEWKRCADPRFEVNAQGQMRTALPLPKPAYIDVTAEFLQELLMLGFFLNPRVWIAGIVLALLTATHWKAFRSGEQRVQGKWDQAKTEQIVAQQAADESARLKSQAAALSYEQTKAKQVIRYVTVTKEIHDATDSAPLWRDAPVPSGVRDAIASAQRAASAASEPDGAVQLPAAGSADERANGAGLRRSTEQPRGLFRSPFSPR